MSQQKIIIIIVLIIITFLGIGGYLGYQSYLEEKKNSLVKEQEIQLLSNTRLNLLYPNGGEKFNRYEKVEIKWRINIPTAKGEYSSSTLYLCKDNKDNTNGCWEILHSISDNIDTAEWLVGTAGTGDLKLPPGYYRIKICNYYGQGKDQIISSDWSDNAFRILPDVPVSSITVLSPNGGEKIKFGDIYEIKWVSTNLTPSRLVSINLNLDYGTGVNAISIASNVPNVGIYKWNTDDPKDYMVYDGGKTGLDELKAILSLPMDKRPDFRIVVFTEIDETMEGSFEIGNKAFIQGNYIRDSSDAPFNFY